MENNAGMYYLKNRELFGNIGLNSRHIKLKKLICMVFHKNGETRSERRGEMKL